MSLVSLKNEFAEDLFACRACLATERKLYSIHNAELSNAYKNLIGIQVSPYDLLPQYFCSYCCALLLKYNSFRDCCHRAKNYLEQARDENKIITLEYLNNFQPEKQYTKIKTKIIDSTENHNTTDEFIPNIVKDDDDTQFDSYDDNHHNRNSSPHSQIDSKIYTDIIKIETLEPRTDETNRRAKKRKLPDLQQIIKKGDTDTDNKKGKCFETTENMHDFEISYNVDVIVLSREQQMKDVLERKLGMNYLHSPFKCELCFKGYMGADMLNKHFMSQHDPSRGSVVCEFCQFRYKDRRGLNQHLKSHRLKFACKQCSYVSRTTFNAKEHFKMHGGQMHECRHCGKCYEKLSSHLSHLRIQHPSEFIWCDVCGDAFIGPFGLNAHKKRAHRHLALPATCSSCNKHFIDNTALNSHSSLDRCSEHSCLHCGEAFVQGLDLRDHLLDKHRSCKVFTCDKCDKIFSRESLYSAHYRRVHVDSEVIATRKKERPWVCEICGKTLPNKCVLLYHQRNHTGEKPYTCNICPKSFTMRKLLQSHLRVHTSDRPYACKLCPKTFKGLSALRGHEHVHTGQTKVSSKNRKQ